MLRVHRHKEYYSLHYQTSDLGGISSNLVFDTKINQYTAALVRNHMWPAARAQRQRRKMSTWQSSQLVLLTTVWGY